MKTTTQIMQEVAAKYPNGCSPEQFTTECMEGKAREVAEMVKMKCAQLCDKSSHPTLSIFQLNVNKFIK